MKLTLQMIGKEFLSVNRTVAWRFHLVKDYQTEPVEVGAIINRINPGLDKLLMICTLKRLCPK